MRRQRRRENSFFFAGQPGPRPHVPLRDRDIPTIRWLGDLQMFCDALPVVGQIAVFRAANITAGAVGGIILNHSGT